MGWSEDLLEAGLITEDEYEFMQLMGYDARHFGDVEDLEDLYLLAYQYGLDELGNRLFSEYDRAIDFYEAKYEYSISYDPSCDRWRDVETGRFVKDPYEFIRE
jgi:hypothetical protein